MRGLILILLLAVIFPECCLGMFRMNVKSTYFPDEEGADTPLLLTPMIEAGKIQEAQNACKVDPLIGNITSCAGYFTVNKTCNANMFFWFIPALNNSTTAPVILWLQGGPGATSMLGLFYLNGPFLISNTEGLKLREHAWTSSHSIIYLDNPVGTGFSFTDDCGYSRNEVEVGLNIYSFLVQFFKLFPQFQKNDFFVAGESYAGKYVPAAGHAIHLNNRTANVKINLKGILIGNGFSDPENMFHYSDFLFQIGLLNKNGRDLFKEKEREIVSSIQQQKWREAFAGFDKLILGDLEEFTLFSNLTGFTYYFNYIKRGGDIKFDKMVEFLSRPDVQKKIHVGRKTFLFFSLKVESYLIDDFMQSVKPWIEELLEYYQVLIYNGALDIIVAASLTASYVEKLSWSGSNTFNTATRKHWYVGNDLAGYLKQGKNLKFLIVRNAGHTVPEDQPEWALDLVTRFTRNKDF